MLQQVKRKLRCVLTRCGDCALFVSKGRTWGNCMHGDNADVYDGHLVVRDNAKSCALFRYYTGSE